jgi:four helix bundle protein
VWQASMSLVEDTYLATKDFPKEETFGLKSQMRRAAVSIPSNMLRAMGESTSMNIYITSLCLKALSQSWKLS